MKVRLLKKLRKEIRRNLYVFKNTSEFTINHAQLTTHLKDIRYDSEEYWGTVTNEVLYKLFIELEHLALRGYIKDKI